MMPSWSDVRIANVARRTWRGTPKFEDDDELDRDRRARGKDVKRARQLLRHQPIPRRERTVFLIVVHRREIAPARIDSRDLRDAGLEVDTEALHRERSARRAAAATTRRSQDESAWREDERRCGRFEHAFGLVKKSCAAATKERKHTPLTASAARGKNIGDDERRRDGTDRNERDEPRVVRREPQNDGMVQMRAKPDAFRCRKKSKSTQRPEEFRARR